MNMLYAVLAVLWILVAVPAHAVAPGNGFELVALGVQGGLHNGRLSAYLIRGPRDTRYLGLDAGTQLSGIRVALARGAFGDLHLPARGSSREGAVLRQGIAGYFISHAHLDHVAGLLMAAPDERGPKPVYALESTLDVLSRDLFNWQVWPNFSDRGTKPRLAMYRLRAEPVAQTFDVEGTAMQGAIWPLSHGGVTSSVIVLHEGHAWFAYFGDTGADDVEHSHDLADIWKRLAPLVRRHALSGLLIETSYPDDVPDTRLYGHLTPKWLLHELGVLQADAGGPGALRGLDVIIGHIKPSLDAGRDTRALIESQLRAGNDLGVHFLFPRQGEVLYVRGRAGRAVRSGVGDAGAARATR